MTLNNSMSITPMPPRSPRGKGSNMGQFSAEKPVAPGSALSGNQHNRSIEGSSMARHAPVARFLTCGSATWMLCQTRDSSGIDALEPERAAVPLKQKLAMDDLYKLGLELDFAKVVRLETIMDEISRTWSQRQRIADELIDIVQEPNALRRRAGLERPVETVDSKLNVVDGAVARRDQSEEVLLVIGVLEIHDDPQNTFGTLFLRDNDITRRCHVIAGKRNLIAAHRPFSCRLLVQRAVGQGIMETPVGRQFKGRGDFHLAAIILADHRRRLWTCGDRRRDRDEHRNRRRQGETWPLH